MTETGEIDLRQPSRMAVGQSSISLTGSDVVLTTPSGRELRKPIVALAHSDYAHYWTDGERMLMVGLLDRRLVLADPHRGFLGVVGELDRLDLSGRYDPGGLERVEFCTVDSGRVAVVFEVGIAMVDLAAPGIAWQRTHDELQAGFEGIVDGVVWFTGDGGRFGFRVDDGSPTHRPFAAGR